MYENYTKYNKFVKFYNKKGNKILLLENKP